MQSLSVWLPKQMAAAHGPTLGKRSELLSLFIDLIMDTLHSVDCGRRAECSQKRNRLRNALQPIT